MPDVEVVTLRPYLNNELKRESEQRQEPNAQPPNITAQASIDEVSRAIAQRARRRFAAAMVPPLLVTALLLYVILTFGI